MCHSVAHRATSRASSWSRAVGGAGLWFTDFYDFGTATRGAAEATTLAPASVDLVAAGQAFHWFDAPAAQPEFRRILRGGGWVAILWNDRRAEEDAFARAYESLLRTCGIDYDQVQHRNVTPDQLRGFFGGDYRTWSFPNEQRFDLEGVRGRLLSSSYAPAPGHPRHDAMMAELRRLVDAHGEGGWARFGYDTRLRLGRPGGGELWGTSPSGRE